MNQEPAKVEADIEEVQGRINYLSGRAAYSTITVNLEPELAEVTPTPTPTPQRWTGRESLRAASSTLAATYRGLADSMIWRYLPNLSGT